MRTPNRGYWTLSVGRDAFNCLLSINSRPRTLSPGGSWYLEERRDSNLPITIDFDLLAHGTNRVAIR
jgi:hypothetical protein